MRLAGFVVLAAVAAGGCATSGAVPSPFPRPDSPASPPAAAPHVSPALEAPSIVDTALSLRGAPYRDGGADPAGFDCSGFIFYVFGRLGQEVPRTVTEQWRLGSKVSRERVREGDLVFFRIGGFAVSHVGIAISPVEFVHAPSSNGVVRVEALGNSYWADRFAGARRLP